MGLERSDELRSDQEAEMTPSRSPTASSSGPEFDVIVIGAGFGGLYALHHFREMGLCVRVYDGAGGVGGTWWWNRYPGARVDFPGGPFYCFTFSAELAREWDWPETQPDQPTVLAYLEYVADKFDLRRDIQLETWIEEARYDEGRRRWVLRTAGGEEVSAQFLVGAVGTLSSAHRPDIRGIDDFAGECYHTGHWPHEPVSFEGKRVGVIGTGSSGVQVIPEIASDATHLTVFQRTPQYSIPARNRPIDLEVMREAQENWPELARRMRITQNGTPFKLTEKSALADTPEERRKVYEKLWETGGFQFLFYSYNDLLTDKEANRTVADFVREKIRGIVRDPEVARKLMPDYYLGTKRQILDGGYYETFNRENVRLVDLREDPIERVTAQGVITRSGEHPLDMLVLATGFDAITGTLLRLNPKGAGGLTLSKKWEHFFDTYLGTTIAGFPNLFLIHGPGSPSVLWNMPLGAEMQTEWIADCIAHLREQGLASIEPAPGRDRAWRDEVDAIANETLFPLADSWYTGANIPGKPRQFAVHLGGPLYFERIREAAANDYEGFILRGPEG